MCIYIHLNIPLFITVSYSYTINMHSSFSQAYANYIYHISSHATFIIITYLSYIFSFFTHITYTHPLPYYVHIIASYAIPHSHHTRHILFHLHTIHAIIHIISYHTQWMITCYASFYYLYICAPNHTIIPICISSHLCSIHTIIYIYITSFLRPQSHQCMYKKKKRHLATRWVNVNVMETRAIGGTQVPIVGLEVSL